MASRNAVALAVALWLGLALGTHGGSFAAIPCVVAGAAAALVPVRGRHPGAFALAISFALLGVARSAAITARDDAALAGFPHSTTMTRLVAVIAEPPRLEGDQPATVLAVIASAPRLPRGTRVRVHLP